MRTVILVIFKVIWEVSVHEDGVSSNFTVWLNEASLIVKQCFVVKSDCPDPERRIPD